MKNSKYHFWIAIPLSLKIQKQVIVSVKNRELMWDCLKFFKNYLIFWIQNDIQNEFKFNIWNEILIDLNQFKEFEIQKLIDI